MIKYKVFVKKESNKGEISRDEAFISDGKMVTRHNNPADTFRIWKEKKKKGESVDWKRGILIENFEGEPAKAILKHVEAELRVLGDKMSKDMEISWKVEIC